jgi:ABC-2 type transport system ATP-binding protein
LREVLAGAGVEIIGEVGSEELHVTGLSARAIGRKAADHGIPLFELSSRSVSLEQAFMDLTRDAVEYHAVVETPGRAA